MLFHYVVLFTFFEKVRAVFEFRLQYINKGITLLMFKQLTYKCLKAALVKVL